MEIACGSYKNSKFTAKLSHIKVVENVSETLNIKILRMWNYDFLYSRFHLFKEKLICFFFRLGEIHFFSLGHLKVSSIIPFQSSDNFLSASSIVSCSDKHFLPSPESFPNFNNRIFHYYHKQKGSFIKGEVHPST